jgi:hypothetical protein
MNLLCPDLAVYVLLYWISSDSLRYYSIPKKYVMELIGQGARNALGLLAQLDQAGDLAERPHYVSYAPLYQDLLNLAKRPNQLSATHVLGELNRIYRLRTVTRSTAMVTASSAVQTVIGISRPIFTASVEPK